MPRTYDLAESYRSGCHTLVVMNIHVLPAICPHSALPGPIRVAVPGARHFRRLAPAKREIHQELDDAGWRFFDDLL